MRLNMVASCSQRKAQHGGRRLALTGAGACGGLPQTGSARVLPVVARTSYGVASLCRRGQERPTAMWFASDTVLGERHEHRSAPLGKFRGTAAPGARDG